MNYPSVRIEGGIFSPDILDRIEDTDGQKPAHFELDSAGKVKDEILRVWADAQHYWNAFQHKLESLKGDSPATTETRNLWIVPLLSLLGYQLEYQARGTELNGKNYPISHRVTNRKQTPLHIIGYREPSGLDRKPEKMALRMSAHALVQEYLNLSDELYGIVTNGRLLRVLRDSSRLVKLSYLEFDLDRIFTDALFADFAVLFRLLHATRLPKNEETAASCWLERYHQKSIDEGTRIRDGLRDAVTEALELLGTGFLAHPQNTALRQQLSSGELRPEAYFNHLLRLVYRLLFLMVVEERGLVVPKGAAAKNVSLYFQHYSVQRLRRLAVTRGLKIERFHDAWLSLLATFELFESSTQAAKIGTTVFGGQLFNPESLGPLIKCRLTNAALFAALERLCYFNHPETKQRTPVNFGALATEEFGSVYESLLELHPVVEIEPALHFGFRQVAGNERKSTGSYYTPTSLVTCLLDSALDPVLEDRIQNFKAQSFKSVDEAVLALNVCDSACGSGHFLIAAAQRIGRRLAILRAGDEEPSPEVLRHTLREVIGNCIHGVDVNPMSVELCKVALWLEAVEPGKSLNFLDHHIKCGNSLLGATPECIRDGIPDKAYEPITGDNKEAAKWMRQLNKDARDGQGHLDFSKAMPWERLGNLPAAVAQLETLDDDTPEALASKEKLYRNIVEGSGYENARLLHDTWCAAFVWPKDRRDYGTEVTTEHLRRIERNPHSVAPDLRAKVRELADEHRFFHWYLEFPAVFGADGKGGFDVVLGNPPWEQVEFDARQFFSGSSPEIVSAKHQAERNRLITKLESKDPKLYGSYLKALRVLEGSKHFWHSSGNFPLTSIGRLNFAPLFVELSGRLTNPGGRAGLVVPTGIVTDSYNQEFVKDLLAKKRLISLFDFENGRQIFANVQGNIKFCLLTMGENKSGVIVAACQLDDPSLIGNKSRTYQLLISDIRILSPNTENLPMFSSGVDVELMLAIHRRYPVIWNELTKRGNHWAAKALIMFMSNSSSHLFKTKEELEGADWNLDGNTYKRDGALAIPFYEAKLINQYNHRSATYEGIEPQRRFKVHAATNRVEIDQLLNPNYRPLPRYWIYDTDFQQNPGSLHRYYLGYRKIISAVADSRSLVSCVIPQSAVSDSFPLFLCNVPTTTLSCLLAGLNSFAVDYSLRQKASGANLNLYIFKQLPFPLPSTFGEPSPWSTANQTLENWFLPRVLELTYTAWDLAPFAQDCGFEGPPFRWDEERRFQLRCELDAAFFHLYLGSDEEWRGQPDSLTKYFATPRDAVTYIMDTFPIVKRNEQEKFGTYRTKDTILKIYDDLAESQRTGRTYVSPLNPPPGDPTCRHPKLKLGILAYGSLIKDPGPEIAPKIKFRIKTVTPFPVEYGRYSGNTRGSAPTVVKHDKGAPVAAAILVLEDEVLFEEARDMLWRRERRKEGSGERYVESNSPNSVLVRQVTDNPCVERILYTDFRPEGKIALPDAQDLAKAAIKSVKAADNGKDGITYLMANLVSGIKTPLTEAYKMEILKHTQTESLEEAFNKSKV